MKRYILAALLPALAASLASAAPSPARAAFPDSRTVAAKYPQSDAVVLYDSLVVSMEEPGRVAKRRHRAVMLLSDNAINRYGDPRILYDAGREELRILAARAHMRDGSAVDTKPNGINRTTPFALDLAPDYADWQETVVTHVGIEKGCVAELEYEIAGPMPSPRPSGVEIFSSEDPVELAVLVVRTPAGAELEAFGMNGAPEAARSAGAWTWTVRDIPGRTPFDGGVWEGNYFPAVCWSMETSWQEALAKIAGELDAASASFPALDEAVRDALKDLVTDEEKILAVQRLAIGAVRGVRVPFALLAAPPRPAARVYDTGYAGPLDRAVLLAAMLRSAGYDPAPVLASAGRIDNFDVAAPQLFGEILVSVAGEGTGDMILAPGSRYERDASYALAGKTLARLEGGVSGAAAKAPHLVKPPSHEPGASRSTLDIELVPGENGALSGKGRAVLGGAFSPYYIVRAGESLEAYVGERVKKLFGGAELAACNALSLDRAGAEVEFSFTVKLPEKGKGERVYLSFPKAFDAAVSGVERVRPGRSAVSDAMRLEPCVLSVSCSIVLPEGWKLVALPSAASLRNDVGAASVKIEGAAGEKRVVRSELLLERDVVAPALYPGLRALLAAAAGDGMVIEKE